MNATEAKMLWLYMRETWPNYALPSGDEAIKLRETVWLDILGDLDTDMLRAIIANLGGREFPPSPGQIRTEYDQARLRMIGDAAPDPDEAWGEVRTMLRECGMRGTPEWSHPAVAATVRALGWRDLCMSEVTAEGTWRAHFMKFYASAAGRHQREAGIGPAPIVAELGRSFALPAMTGEHDELFRQEYRGELMD